MHVQLQFSTHKRIDIGHHQPGWKVKLGGLTKIELTIGGTRTSMNMLGGKLDNDPNGATIHESLSPLWNVLLVNNLAHLMNGVCDYFNFV